MRVGRISVLSNFPHMEESSAIELESSVIKLDISVIELERFVIELENSAIQSVGCWLVVVVYRHIQRYFSYIVTGQMSSFQILTCCRAPNSIGS